MKCTKCGFEGNVGPRAQFIMHPPSANSSPFGRAEPVRVHIVDGPDCLRRQLASAAARIRELEAERDGWHRVVVDCERVLGCPDTAESPRMSNLANLCRDFKAEIGRRKTAHEAAMNVVNSYGPCGNGRLSKNASLHDRVFWLGEQYEHLRVIVEKLPKTEDGITIVWGMRLFWNSSDPRSSTVGFDVVGIDVGPHGHYAITCDVDGEEVTAPDDFGLFSTREAAEAAKESKP